MKTLCWSVAGMMLAGSMVMADGMRNPPEGAAALGKAGVATVNVTDPSAVSHNSARLAEIGAPTLEASLTLGYATTEYDSPLGSAETDDPLKLLPNLYFATPLKDSGWVGAIGVTTPYGQSTVWKDDGAFRYTSPYVAEMLLADVAPTFARKFDRLEVGAGLDLYAASLSMKQRLPIPMLVPPGADRPDPRLELDGNGAALGGHLGISYQVCDYSVIGLSWRSAFSMDFDGKAKFKDAPVSGPLSEESDFSTSMEFPNIVALGCGMKLSDTLQVEVQAEWLENSRYEDLVLDLDNNTAALGQSTIPQDWQDTWTYGIGADWTFAPDRVLRAGYAYVESPIPDRTFSPNIPDADRHVLSLGLGLKQGAGWWDVAYAYSLVDDRHVDDNQNPAFNGDYEINPHLLAITYRRAF